MNKAFGIVNFAGNHIHVDGLQGVPSGRSFLPSSADIASSTSQSLI